MTEFERIVPALGQALSQRGYDELTPVQKAVLEPILEGVDALVSAQTGSGKTVAFGLAIAPTLLAGAKRLPPPEKPLALVVAPTRELALQVKRELDWLYEHTGALITSCVGGMDIRTERRALEHGVHIVVGTPGRLCDHIRRRALDTRHLKAVVLDEADEMLDLGFKEDLEFILENTPEDRQTLMFSATVPAMISKLAKQYQRDAVRVTTSEEQKQHVDIEYRALMVAPREREHAIINVLRYYEAKNALVFCNTRATVNHMMARLNNRGFSVVALSGELSQSERTHALQAMRDGRARVCIATDVAARGIDLPNLELVIHADLPSNPDTLLHRSGRTGRAGRKGVSALIIDNKNRKKAERVLRFAKLNAEWAAPPSVEEVNRRDEERILADPILTDPLGDNETALVGKLVENHTPEQLAAAFLRLNRKGRSAPEELEQMKVFEPDSRSRGNRSERAPRKQREEFAKSVWFSISVGRKQNAEPRWLIPLLCNAGEITKGEIGVIKMQNEETFVQLNAEYSDKFFDTLGPNQTLEKNIQVKRLEGKPTFSHEPFVKSDGPKPHRKGPGVGKKKWVGKPDRDKPYKGKKKFKAAVDGGDVPAKPKRKFGPKPGEPTPPKSGKPKFKKDGPKKDSWARKKPKAGTTKKKPRKASKKLD